jgi:hypothetical protein
LVCLGTSKGGCKCLKRRTVAFRHHLATMVLSSLYTVTLRCSCDCGCRKHEFLDIREYHVWLQYDVRCRRTHGFIQWCNVIRAAPGPETYTLHCATAGTEVYNCMGQLQGPKSTTVWDNSRDRSLQLYGTTPGTEVYNCMGRLQGPKSATVWDDSRDRSLQLYGTTPGTEVYNCMGQLQGPKSATVWDNSIDRSLQLCGTTPGTEAYNCMGQLQGPKSTTVWDKSRDRSLQLYGTTLGTEVLYVLIRPLPVTEVPLWPWENTPSAKTCTSTPTFLNHP